MTTDIHFAPHPPRRCRRRGSAPHARGSAADVLLDRRAAAGVVRELLRGRSGERGGGASVEAAILAVTMGVLLSFGLAGGRLVAAESAGDQAARAAARIASAQRDPATAAAGRDHRGAAHPGRAAPGLCAADGHRGHEPVQPPARGTGDRARRGELRGPLVRPRAARRARHPHRHRRVHQPDRSTPGTRMTRPTARPTPASLPPLPVDVWDSRVIGGRAGWRCGVGADGGRPAGAVGGGRSGRGRQPRRAGDGHRRRDRRGGRPRRRPGPRLRRPAPRHRRRGPAPPRRPRPAPT